MLRVVAGCSTLRTSSESSSRARLLILCQLSSSALSSKMEIHTSTARCETYLLTACFTSLWLFLQLLTEISWLQAITSIHNIVMGKIYLDHKGSWVVRNPGGNFDVHMKFTGTSILASKRKNEVRH